MIDTVTGVDSTRLTMSLATAWRHRRCQAEEVAAQEIASFVEAVEESHTKVLVQFDEKEIEEDLDGKVVKTSRLLVVFSSPWLQKEQLMSAIPLHGKTGKFA